VAISPRQIRREGAGPGQALVWDGQKWTAGDDVASLHALVEFQGTVIRALAGMLQAERFNLPPEVEEYLNGTS
jgi:hypothetical protein